MQSQRLYHSVEILRAEESAHAYGGEVRTFVPVAQVRAFVRLASSGLALSDGEVFTSANVIFECNEYVRNIAKEYDFVRYEGQTYRVESLEWNRTLRKVLITCSRNND